MNSRESIMLSIGQSANPCCNIFYLNWKKTMYQWGNNNKNVKWLLRGLQQDSVVQRQEQKKKLLSFRPFSYLWSLHIFDCGSAAQRSEMFFLKDSLVFSWIFFSFINPLFFFFFFWPAKMSQIQPKQKEPNTRQLSEHWLTLLLLFLTETVSVINNSVPSRLEAINFSHCSLQKLMFPT